MVIAGGAADVIVAKFFRFQFFGRFRTR